MNTLDIILLLLFIPAIVRGISKGLIEQVIGMASLFLSAYLAYLFADKVGTWLKSYIGGVNTEVLYVIAFILIIIVTVFLLRFFAKFLTGVVKTLSLGWIDSALGLVLAVLNATLIIGVIFAILNSFNASTFHIDTSFMDSSVIYRWISRITETLLPFIKDIFNQISDAGAKMC